MPTVAVDVENTEQTVTRRVVFDVVNDLIAAFGLCYDVQLLYPNATDPEDLPVQTPSRGDSRFDESMKILVRANETFMESDVAVTMMRPHDNPPIFHDKDLGVMITPIYARTELNLELQFRMPDRNAAVTLKNDFRRRASLNQDGLYHEVKYHYLIPKVDLVILDEIYKKREAQAGYVQTKLEYFTEKFSDQVSTLANADNSRHALSKDEVQADVLGFYEFEIVPDDPEASASRSSSTLTVTYRLRYDKPVATVMTYPLVIHNQPISSRFYDNALPYELGERLKLPSRFRSSSDHFTNNEFVTGFPMGAPVPTILDWLPPTTPPNMEGLMRIMALVSPSDRHDLVDLQALGQIEFRAPFLNYMLSEYQNLSKPNACAIYVGLYENDRVLGHDKIIVDETLKIRTRDPMDLRKQYNVWVALLTNLEFLRPDAVDRLRRQGDIFVELILGIDPYFPRNRLPKMLSGNYVPRAEFERVVDELNYRTRPLRNDSRKGHFIVGNFVVKV